MAKASRKTTAFWPFVSLLALLATGCTLPNTFSDNATASSPLPAMSGVVHGGVQPISGATIQLYATNTTTSKGPSTPLLTHLPVTGAAGNFTITDTNYCPSSSSLVYLVATGGNPGITPSAGGTVNNTAIALMSLLGTCGTISTSTKITVNELTTVAAVEALAPFMADSTDIGADASNPNGMAGAFASAESFVNFSTGVQQPAVTGVTAPTALLNTLADILAACVSTSGPSGTSTNCPTLLQNATNGATTDTVLAILHIVQLPAQNVANLFTLANSQSPFQPALTTAPTDFTAPTVFSLPFTGSTFATTLAIDRAQHIWVASSQPLSGNTNVTGPLAVFDNSGNQLFTVQPGAGGLYMPIQLAADPFGNMWALNNNGTLSKFDSNGNALSPSAGFPVLATTPSQTQILQNDYTGVLLSIDPSGNLWGPGTGTGANNCYTEVGNAGTIITPTSSFCGGGGNALFTTTDGSGDAWLLGTNAISKVSSEGTLLASGVNTNGCFNVINNSANSTVALAYDRGNNQVWGVSILGMGALRSDGTQVFCDANGANLPIIPLYNNVTGSGATANGSIGDLLMASAALDGAGTMWFNTGGFQAVVTSGISTITSIAGLHALDKTGKLLTPYNATAGIYGLHTQVYQTSGIFDLGRIAIDADGNIWLIGAITPSTVVTTVAGTTVVSASANELVKIPGLAAPKSYQ